ncbi:peptidoglycan branched peptide synthesis protein MurN [Streptococcus troglodytae]|uniref:Peptidoglycan branched peptide synthesis protein MurN n=1 Tax=Streptococcus troglodytae TaxID=1111760 RepID=A0A1L7LKM3_9STRE|nr:peptidoglycan branched peptide synthesis protein MurN [Streptococcus troglodytae]
MALQNISKNDFAKHAQKANQKSFMQTLEMAKLLSKRGFALDYIAWLEKGEIEISAILYNMPMTGGLYFEINCGPVVTRDEHLTDFYRELKDYVKEKGALELVIKPYDTYQTFDSDGQATSAEKKNLSRN